LPRLGELDAEFEGRPVFVVALLSGRMTAVLREFVRECGVERLVREDETGEIGEAYRVASVPTTVVIDPDGRLMFSHVGYEEGLEDLFAEEIETLLAWANVGR
jgi:hypothetical protein